MNLYASATRKTRPRQSIIGSLAAVTLFFIPLLAWSAAGELDPAFGNNGIATDTVGDEVFALRGVAEAVLRQESGGLVVLAAGELIRYNADGTRDESFGSRGKAFNLAGMGKNFLLQKADEKILLVGSTTSGINLVRYNENGEIDTAFGNHGMLFHRFRGSGEIVSALLQDNGKILMAGKTYESGSPEASEFALFRFMPDGSFDTSFGFDGRVSLRSGRYAVASGISETSDGKILVAGTDVNQNYSSAPFSVYRLHENGQIDQSFGTDGILNSSQTVSANLKGMTVLNDGTIIIYGKNIWSITENGASYSSLSALDKGIAYDAKLSSDGGVVFVGGSDPDPYTGGADARSFVLKINSDRTADPDFGSSGIEWIALNPSNDDRFNTLTIGDDGFIYAAGGIYPTNDAYHAIAKVSMNGDLDASFGNNGIVAERVYGSRVSASAIASDPSGDIFVAGTTENGSDRDFVVAKYQDVGVLDTAFGSSGYITTDFNGRDDVANDLSVLPDGRIIVAGRTDTDLLIARYLSDGSPDPSFGSNGMVQVSITDKSLSSPYISVTDGGNLIVGAVARESGDSSFLVIRIHSDGLLDTSFGVSGYSYWKPAGWTVGTGKVFSKPDGKIIVVGDADYSDVAVWQLNQDGSTDLNYGDNGHVLFGSTETGSTYSVSDALLQDDGKLVVVGHSPASGDIQGFIARLQESGSPDLSFGQGGLSQLANSYWSSFESVAQQPDGRLFVSGKVNTSERVGALAAIFDNSGAPAALGGDGFWLSNARYLANVEDLAMTEHGLVAVSSGGHDNIIAFRYSIILDSDLDGVNDSLDAFPDNSAASVDADSDGYPDAWNASCDLNCQTNSGLEIDPYPGDADNDGVPDSEDPFPEDPARTADSDSDGVSDSNDAFPTNSAASVDDDNDGLADSWNEGCGVICQDISGLSLDPSINDSDNDGVINELDAFPYDPEESSDSDLDGIGDNGDAFADNPAASKDADADGYPDEWNSGCDSICQDGSGLIIDPYPDDSDNDGVTNSQDAFPHDPSESVDSDNDGFGDNADAFPYDASEWLDSDGDGVGDNADPDPLKDDQDPVVTPPNDLVVNAKGDLEEVNLGQASAFDAKDGELVAAPDQNGPFTSGVHLIEWSATDAAGNKGVATQKLTVYPAVEFSAEELVAGEGGLVEVVVRLTGVSPAYPVQIPVLLGTGTTASYPDDHNATYRVLTIDESSSNQEEAVYQFSTVDDGVTGEPDEVVELLLDDTSSKPYTGLPGEPDRFLALGPAAVSRVIITEENLPPVLAVSVTQRGEEKTTIIEGTGAVNVSVSIEDPNPDDTHSLRWFLNGAALPEYDDVKEAVIASDTLVPGIHTVRVEVADSGVPPRTVVEQQEITVKEQRASQASGSGSSGGGGIGSSFLFLLAFVWHLRRQPLQRAG